jgi:hypothetical protein
MTIEQLYYDYFIMLSQIEEMRSVTKYLTAKRVSCKWNVTTNQT